MPESSADFNAKTGTLIEDSYRWLIRPAKTITGVERRLKARLLSSLILLALLILLVSRLVAMATTPDFVFDSTDAVGYILLGIAYALSRSKWYQVGAWLMIFPIPVLILVSLIAETPGDPQYNMMYLIISLILASIFFQLKGMIAMALVTTGLIYYLPQFAPEMFPDLGAVIRPLAAYVLSAVLLVVFVLQRNRIEKDRQRKLTKAYDATIEGWARALELRDKETLGHSKRVTALTLLLAKKIGVKTENLEHIRRGALLHDIGKMSIPDDILTKADPLTAEDWKVLKKHPEIGYELLKTIEHLQPALDIPLYHHEQWDGSGYPYGLEGREIPLAARIFAVIDVWDALLSDRPYREAWRQEMVVAYMEEQAGKYFDPDILVSFLEMVAEGK